MAVAPTRTDAELVRRLQGRDHAAWEELYAEYHPRLRAFGYRLAGNTHDADDLAQETFVRALPALDRLDPDAVDLGAYLFATAKNLFLKQVERTKRAEPTAEVPEPDLPTAIEDDPERSTLLTRQQEEVRVANARLDPRQRLVLALCELEERSYAEIGELVGLNENAVAQLVFRARERLRTELRLVQVDPESLPEECRAFLPLLAQHLDGKLSGTRREPTLAHLDSCERCQAALADMQEAKRRYRALLLPPLGVSTEEARAAVEDELDRTGYWDRPGAARPGAARRRRPRGKAAAAALVGAAALLVGGGLGAATLLADSSRVAAPSVPGTSQTSTAKPVQVAPPPAPATTAPPPIAPAGKKQPEPAPKPKAAPPASTGETTTAPTSPASAPPPEPGPTVATPPGTTARPRPSRPRPPTARPPAPPTSRPKDTTAPHVTFTGGPPASTAETSATLAFAANEAGAALSCRVDGGAWQPCTSPAQLAGLAVGSHSFSARATDAAGNLGPAATRQWTVTPPPDTAAPTVSFTQAPPPSSTARSATFAFTASEAGVAFACSYDGGPFAPCQSPHTIPDAGVDDHSLAVRATDQAGNTGPPATATWTVVAPLPDLVVSLTATSVTVRNAGEGPAGASLVTVTSVGTFTITALSPGQSVTRTYACKAGTITATADYSKIVAESDEANNTATRVVTCLSFGS